MMGFGGWHPGDPADDKEELIEVLELCRRIAEVHADRLVDFGGSRDHLWGGDLPNNLVQCSLGALAASKRSLNSPQTLKTLLHLCSTAHLSVPPP
jgi:hypothetical protein